MKPCRACSKDGAATMSSCVASGTLTTAGDRGRAAINACVLAFGTTTLRLATAASTGIRRPATDRAAS
jgi:hypothetical protein